jgi:mitogen-activated protein kinase kinase
MANRASQSPDVDAATAAFKRISLGAPTSQLRTPSGGPPLRPSSVLSPGMAARRNKPVFKLSDITGELGGDDADAGPGAAVPADTDWPPRRSAAASSTPFANFGKIVYVPLTITTFCFLFILLQ